AVAVDLPSGSYQLDPRHASVLFRIRHMGLAWFTARFEAKAATLELDARDPSRSRLTASVDAASVNTGLPDASEAAAFNRQIARAGRRTRRGDPLRRHRDRTHGAQQRPRDRRSH